MLRLPRGRADTRGIEVLWGDVDIKLQSKSLAFAIALLAFPVSIASSAEQHSSVGGLDHVLIWSRNIDQITSVMAVKLGFQVRPGGDFGDGAANRIIPFADDSYLELLYFTRPEVQLTDEVRKHYAATERGAAADMFAMESSDVDALERQLERQGWELAPSSPMTYDPDGDGPEPSRESMWRTVGFKAPPFAGTDLFFIRYAPRASAPADQADQIVFRRHPNTAQRISAVWLLGADAKATSERLSRMSLTRTGEVTLSEHGLRGFRFDSGDETILALEPTGPGSAADALKERGPHIYGISIAVADVGQARRISEWGYGREMKRYQGLLGDSFAAPTTADLGFVMEFHQVAPPR